MDFNESLGQFACEKDGLIFAWDEEPGEDEKDVIDMLTENYHSHVDQIAEFMLPDLQQMYGDIDIETVKEKLGKHT